MHITIRKRGKLMKWLKRLFCKHKYMPYQYVYEDNKNKIGKRRRTIWKCTHCGKEKMGL